MKELVNRRQVITPHTEKQGADFIQTKARKNGDVSIVISVNGTAILIQGNISGYGGLYNFKKQIDILVKELTIFEVKIRRLKIQGKV